MTIFTYHINLNERGMFYADVRRGGCNGSTVYETKDIMELIEDGHMKHSDDTKGLTEYLRELGLFSADDRIGTEDEAEAARKRIYEVKVTRIVTMYYYHEQEADSPEQAKKLAANYAARNAEQWQFQNVEFEAAIDE